MDEFKKREVSGNLSVAVDVLIFTRFPARLIVTRAGGRAALQGDIL